MQARDESTQFLGRRPLPPEAPGPDAEATQYIGALSSSGPDAEATQYIGALSSSGPDAEATQYIGAPVTAGQGTVPDPGRVPAPPSRPPYDIRPGSPGDRQPPAEFDGLFRSEGSGQAPGATQQLPRFEEPAQYQEHPQEPQGRAARRAAGHRKLSPAALIGIVVVGCSLAGLAAGAALSGNESADQAPSGSSSQAASDDAGGSTPAAGRAEQQAKSLDALLEDSNNSRTVVITSVRNIAGCQNLGQAAQDLRGAAGQRNGLVTRLRKISVDKLPGHQELTTSLTSAWEASAAADNHFAAWADQMASGKKGCRKGKARATDETAAANRASGEATQAKQKAAELWNAIASKYNFKRRDATQL